MWSSAVKMRASQQVKAYLIESRSRLLSRLAWPITPGGGVAFRC